MTGPTAEAQTTNYTCFPSCATNDGRFLSLAGSGIDAFAGNAITIGIGLPPNATGVEIGIFDGESSGNWDKGTFPLDYELYADPNGDGSGAVLLATYSGSNMTDNGWYTITRSIDAGAEAANGNFVYYLRISMPSTASGSTSSFKLRTNGTITVRSHQSFSIQAPLFTVNDARTIYPNWDLYPGTDLNRYANAKYDGSWNIYLDVLNASSDLTVWDGDMDHGSSDASAADTDDQDTPTDLPSWSTSNVVTEGSTTASPYDDNASPINRRSPAVRYDMIFPDQTTVFANSNPSGNLEWEQFKISTATMNADSMDAHADEIPAGIYNIRLQGMDMLNVNAWRFFNNVVTQPTVSNVEVIGVNEAGLPVAPIRAIETVNGSVSGTVFYDTELNGVQDAGEPGIPTVTVKCHRLNTDGSIASTTVGLTNVDGNYTFSKLGAGSYAIEVDNTTLHSDVVATYDADGTTTANVATHAVSANASNIVSLFGYKRSTTVATGTRGYWTNHEENWPVQQLSIGGITYTKAQLLTILRRPTKGDKAYSMAAQLIATKLNLANGSDASCIGSDVVAADEWLETYPLNQGKTSTQAWSAGSAAHDNLDDYNNGRLCAPHMN